VTVDQALRKAREALAKIAQESFDPWAAKQAREALDATKPGA
jgi:hypothetical protein